MNTNEIRGAKVVIESKPVNGVATVSKIFVDGVDFSAKTTKIVFEHDAAHAPSVTLTLIPGEVSIRTVGDVGMKKLL